MKSVIGRVKEWLRVQHAGTCPRANTTSTKASVIASALYAIITGLSFPNVMYARTLSITMIQSTIRSICELINYQHSSFKLNLECKVLWHWTNSYQLVHYRCCCILSVMLLNAIVRCWSSTCIAAARIACTYTLPLSVATAAGGAEETIITCSAWWIVAVICGFVTMIGTDSSIGAWISWRYTLSCSITCFCYMQSAHEVQHWVFMNQNDRSPFVLTK